MEDKAIPDGYPDEKGGLATGQMVVFRDDINVLAGESYPIEEGNNYGKD